MCFLKCRMLAVMMHDIAKLLEGGLAVGCPGKGGVLFGQIKEGAGSVGETFDKAAVEVSESEKGLHLLPVAWLRPVDHG